MTGHPVFAWFYRCFGRAMDKVAGFDDHRRRLLAETRGTVVEIGAGTGLNLPYYPAGVEVIATEPDPHMIKGIGKSARSARAAVTVRQAGADALPFADESVETVVSTGVLCSVPSQETALAEISRILKPGGTLLLLEHVRSADPDLAAKQDRGERSQMRIAGGCHPNRDTLASIEASGFETDGIRAVTLPGRNITRPGIEGVARKPSSHRLEP